MEEIKITDWLMVIITFVYVVATIFIWRANNISAKATKDQLEESKRQFDEQRKQFEEQKRQFEQTLRPCISCEYILKSRCACCVRFINYGNRPAHNVKFKINEDFIAVLKSPYKEFFVDLNSIATYSFGIGQHYDFYFGNISEFKNDKRDFIVAVEYDWNNQHYKEEQIIEFTKYLPIQSIDEFEDKLLNEIKAMSRSISKISNQGEKNV